MHVVLVHIHVKAEFVEAFQQAILENARSSVLEPGIMRFDVFQQKEDPTRFTLVEVYRDGEAPLQHKQSAHYHRWREMVADMMAEPRQGIAYTNLFPDDEHWG